ncbi:MAG TPA: rhomboid family intramembrane serine protease [Bacteroidales bacterium]
MFGQQQPQRNTGEILKKIFFSNTVLSRLILINTVIYLLVKIIGLFAYLFMVNHGDGVILSLIGKYMALPSDLSLLASKPWTVFTYMFLQEEFFHILFNIIMLYFGGLIFLEYLSPSKLLWTYILGGLSGAFFFVLAFNIFPVFEQIRGDAVALGASASVLAIIIAIATYVPDYTIQLILFGRIKLKYLALIFILIDVLSIPSGNPGGHIAHLGGAFWGFVYATSLRKGNNFLDFSRFFTSIKLPFFGNKRKATKFETTRPESGRPLSDDVYNEKRAELQEEIDLILEKISRSGYSSLSKEEKDLLFKSSNKK